MKQKVIGFYWTLPVPWAGFVSINEKNVEEAATQSRTINMQRTAIQRWVAENRLELVHEEVFLEISPDRGSELVRDRLQELVDIAEQRDAEIVYVDFGTAIGWRSHHFIRAYVGQNEDLFLPVDLRDEDWQLFEEHFATWRERQRVWMDSKSDRWALAHQRAQQLRHNEGFTQAEIADALNREGITTLTGKPWTSDNLRKFLKIVGGGD